jgi:hypothetical protein
VRLTQGAKGTALPKRAYVKQAGEPNNSIEATGINRSIVDRLVAAERCVTY